MAGGNLPETALELKMRFAEMYGLQRKNRSRKEQAEESLTTRGVFRLPVFVNQVGCQPLKKGVCSYTMIYRQKTGSCKLALTSASARHLLEIFVYYRRMQPKALHR